LVSAFLADILVSRHIRYLNNPLKSLGQGASKRQYSCKVSPLPELPERCTPPAFVTL
jgi:hypothetical protein